MQYKNSTNKNNKRLVKYFVAAGFLGAFVSGYIFLPEFNHLSYDAKVTKGESAAAEAMLPPPAAHLPTPEPLKGIYMSQCAVGTPSFRTALEKLINDSELNAIVIDIKDYAGKISFPSEDPLLKDKVSNACGAKDMKDYLEKLHKEGIYVIGRITVFQDPYMSKIHPELAVRKKSDGGVWKDYKGLSFIDVGARQQWEYIAKLAKASYDIGFDEVNFDYVRYPSDGDMKDTDFTLSGTTTKPEMLRQFFSYLHDSLKDTPVKTSADLFGMTTTNNDDLNIGQLLENALPYFDYVSPMVYPSHYPPNFNGWSDPNKYPYEVVQFSMASAVRRAVSTTTPIKLFSSILVSATTATSSLTGKLVIKNIYSKDAYNKNKLRPWLQDFNYGGYYGPVQIDDQIRATYDNGLTSWLFWDAGNKYAGLEKALASLATTTSSTASNQVR